MPTYPGVYRAKAARLENSKLSAFIPQVFGDVMVTIENFVGDAPTTNAMGWVSFQGGNPEFPVWHGGGGGGGTGTVTDVMWVGPEAPTSSDIELWWDTDEPPAGGGTEEVYIGAEPPGAGYELWYDTDASAPLTIDQRWNTAWGIVATGSYKAGMTNPVVLSATFQRVTEPITITTMVGRRYRINFQSRAINAAAVANGSANFMVYDGGIARPNLGDWYSLIVASGTVYNSTDWGAVVEGDGLAHTYEIWGRAWVTNANVHWDLNCRYYIEDVGPTVQAPAPAPVDWTMYDARFVNVEELAPAWISLALSGSYIAELQAPAYRKIGDIVYVRGVITLVGTFAPLLVATLPSGYRPPTGMRIMMGAHKANVGGEYFVRGAVNATGTIDLSAYNNPDKVNPVIYLSDIPPVLGESLMGVLNAKVGTEWVPISAGQYNVEHWNSGWGIVASGSLLTPSPLSLPLNATTQITSSLPFTTQAGRRYRVVVEARAIRSTTTAQTYASISLRDGATGLYPQSAIHWVSSTTAPTVYNTLYYEWVLAGDGVARSYNVALTSVTVTSELYTDYLGYFYIEDVGPVNRLAQGATPPDSDWTAYDARYVTPSSLTPRLPKSYTATGIAITAAMTTATNVCTLVVPAQSVAGRIFVSSLTQIDKSVLTDPLLVYLIDGAAGIARWYPVITAYTQNMVVMTASVDAPINTARTFAVQITRAGGSGNMTTYAVSYHNRIDAIWTAV